MVLLRKSVDITNRMENFSMELTRLPGISLERSSMKLESNRRTELFSNAVCLFRDILVSRLFGYVIPSETLQETSKQNSLSLSLLRIAHCPPVTDRHKAVIILSNA